MRKFNTNFDKMISRILNEEVDKKFKKITETFKEGEWTEIEMDEELHGGQKKLDVAKPKGKLTADDFKKLRGNKGKKQEVDEWIFYDLENQDEEEAEKLSNQEPTYVGRGLSDNKPGKMFGSFSDEDGWYDDSDRSYSGDFDFDFDEEEFDDFETFHSKYGKNQPWFASGDEGRTMFNKYREIEGKPFRVRKMRYLDEEAETEEGNAFSGALANAKKQGKNSFEVDGKKYNVKEAKEKWIQKTGMKKGSLHKKLGVPEGDKIPTSKLKSLKTELTKKAEGSKKLSTEDSKLLKQVNLALTLKGLKEGKNNLKLTESELVDMIEKIVLEQKVKDSAQKENISKKSPEGLKKTVKILGQNKKENDDYAKEVVEKMKKYVKGGSNGKFEENPESFPKSNYQMKKDDSIMKYNPSQAVEEYIDAFAYPGMTNLVFDEIKPDDEKISKYIKGDSTTGNATKDKDGKALGNVVPSEVGEKFMKNYEDNLYGAEQMNVSYKRQPQPVDVGGSAKLNGSLKSIRKGSTNKASKIMNQLESTETKKGVKVNEEMNKMKNLISYNRKTQ
jgi:hypothetical protein